MAHNSDSIHILVISILRYERTRNSGSTLQHMVHVHAPLVLRLIFATDILGILQYSQNYTQNNYKIISTCISQLL